MSVSRPVLLFRSKAITCSQRRGIATAINQFRTTSSHSPLLLKSRKPRAETLLTHRTPYLPSRSFTSTHKRHDKTATPPPPAPTPKKSTTYTFSEIQSLSTSPSPQKVLIDVRSAPELASTGRIPGSRHIPLNSDPDFAFLDAAEFENRFGFPRPTDKDEVIFYCKAGVRSRAAAEMAVRGGLGGKVGEFPGSWDEWVAKGGKVERG